MNLLQSQHLLAERWGTQSAWPEPLLAAQDTAHSAIWPQALTGDPSALQRLQGWAAMFSAHSPKVPAVLPSSTYRKAQWLVSLNPKVVVVDAVDPLLPLAFASAKITTHVLGMDAQIVTWLDAIAAQNGFADFLHHGLPQDKTVGLYCAAAGAPGHNHRWLGRANKVVAKGGHLAVAVSGPRDDAWQEAIKDQPLDWVGQLREVDHRIVPAGTVLPGASDLALLRLQGSLSGLAATDDVAEGEVPFIDLGSADVASLPSLWLDIDALRDDVLDAEHLRGVCLLLDQRWQDFVAAFVHAQALGPVTAEPAGLEEAQGRLITSWCTAGGLSITFVLTPDERHLLMNLMPYHEVLESLALDCALTVLGDAFSQVRPHRTYHHQGRNIVV